MKKYFAEFLGTFFLAFVVYVSVASGWSGVATPVLAALTLGLAVYTLGHISGTHINPAVTLGLFSIGKVSAKDTAYYIVSQFAGALVAMLIAAQVFGLTTAVVAGSGIAVLLGEALGAMFFTFGIASAVYGRAEKSFSGVVVGGSLLLGVAVAASLGTNGVLNPAVAFSIGSFNIMYVLGPILGSLLGFNLYKLLSEK